MPDLWSDLLACLDPQPVPSRDTGGEGTGADVTEFEGSNQRLEYHRVFGGQLLAQFIRIATATCPDKDVKSQHAVFSREGRADEPIRYQATRHHEGRSFATITITARQSGGAVATSSICMHTSEDGPEHQTVDEVPPVLGPDHQVALDLIPWETRATVDLNATTTGPPEFEVWMRTPAVDPALAPALAAYGTISRSSVRLCDRWTVSVSEVTAHGSLPRSHPTPSGFIGRFALIRGCCSGSTARYSRTAAASAAATSSPKTARWSPRTPRKPYCDSRAEVFDAGKTVVSQPC